MPDSRQAIQHQALIRERLARYRERLRGQRRISDAERRFYTGQVARLEKSLEAQEGNASLLRY